MSREHGYVRTAEMKYWRCTKLRYRSGVRLLLVNSIGSVSGTVKYINGSGIARQGNALLTGANRRRAEVDEDSPVTN